MLNISKSHREAKNLKNSYRSRCSFSSKPQEGYSQTIWICIQHYITYVIADEPFIVIFKVRIFFRSYIEEPNRNKPSTFWFSQQNLIQCHTPSWIRRGIQLSFHTQNIPTKILFPVEIGISTLSAIGFLWVGGSWRESFEIFIIIHQCKCRRSARKSV